MSDAHDVSPEEAAQLFGSPVEPIPPDDKEIEVALALRRLRAFLAEAAEKEGVGVNALAARLGVSPSVVSRLLRSDGDMRVSTAVLWAHALGYVWDFYLNDARARAVGSNQSISVSDISEGPPTSGSGTLAPCVITMDLGKRKPAEIVRSDRMAIA